MLNNRFTYFSLYNTYDKNRHDLSVGCLFQRSTFQRLPAVFVSWLSLLKPESFAQVCDVLSFGYQISKNWEVHALAFLSLFPTHRLNRAVDPLQISISSTMHCNLTFVS